MYSPHLAVMAWMRCSTSPIAAGSWSGWPLAAVAKVFWFCWISDSTSPNCPMATTRSL